MDSHPTPDPACIILHQPLTPGDNRPRQSCHKQSSSMVTGTLAVIMGLDSLLSSFMYS